MTCFEFPTLPAFSWIVHVFQMCWSKSSLSFFVVNMFSVRRPLLSADAWPCPVRGLCLFTSVTWQEETSKILQLWCKLLTHTVKTFKAVLLWMFQLVTLCCLRNKPSTLQALFITCGNQSWPGHVVLGSRLCYRKQEMLVQNLRAASGSHVKAKSQHSAWCSANQERKLVVLIISGDVSSLAWLSRG